MKSEMVPTCFHEKKGTPPSVVWRQMRQTFKVILHNIHVLSLVPYHDWYTIKIIHHFKGKKKIGS
jgi:hypothetical protein